MTIGTSSCGCTVYDENGMSVYVGTYRQCLVYIGAITIGNSPYDASALADEE